MTDFDKKMLLGIAALIGGYLLYRKASGVVGTAAQAINPANPENIINQGATSVYQSVTGSSGSIGGDIYDLLHPIPGINRPSAPAQEVAPSGDSSYNLF